MNTRIEYYDIGYFNVGFQRVISMLVFKELFQCRFDWRQIIAYLFTLPIE